MEVWKPIPGYEGLYEASSLGRNPGYVGTCLLRGKDAVSKSGKKYKIIFQD